MQPSRVDYQTHWYPESYFVSILGRSAYPRAERLGDGAYFLEMRPGGWRYEIPRVFVDLDTQLADADTHGIDVMVSSPSIVGEVGDLDLGEAKEVVAHLNEESARAQREHPDRFVGTAMLTIQDVEASIEALDRAVELGLTAVCMLSNSAGRPIATDETLPLYERIEAHGLPIVLHPANHTLAAPSGVDLVSEVGVGWMSDTTSAALSLISSGTLDACPGLRILHPHVGGVVPFILGRLKIILPMWAGREIEHPLEHYLRTNFFVDSVCQTPGALQLGIDCYGLDRVVFASDYPWTPSPDVGRRNVEETVSAEAAEAILFTNQMPFAQRVLDELATDV
jgi:predicted TIM-barrel fold metal-dependent hydrolase